MAKYEYRIGPLESDSGSLDVLHWRAPVASVGMVDLGVESDFANPNSDRGKAFFAVPIGTVLAESTWPIIAIGDLRDIPVTTLMQDAWQSETGIRPQGVKLVDLLWDHLTAGSDPDWGTSVKPLVPTKKGVLNLHLGGHSRIKSERFQFGVHSHTAKIEALLQRDYARVDADVKAGKSPSGLDRMVLDYWLDKYRIDKRDPSQWKRLVPPNLRKNHPGPLKHQTTVSDDFNRANAATLGSNWTSTGEASGIDSNNCRCPDSGVATAVSGVEYYNATALSGDDHSSTITVLGVANDHASGTIVRKPNSGTVTFYHVRMNTVSGEVDIAKWVSGTATVITSTSASPSTPYDAKTQADGSDIEGILGGVTYGPTTDTSITGNLYCGFRTYLDAGSAVRYDDWSAADLAVGGPTAQDYYYRQQMAVLA